MTPDRVAELLRALGSTADEVAETLRRGGYRGERQRCDVCPIAQYLGANDVDGPAVYPIVVFFGPECEAASNPEGAYLFMRAFDEGGYPDLVAPVSP